MNISEPIMLHAFNNAVSSFLSADFTLASGDLSLWVPLLMSVAVYGALLIVAARATMRAPPSEFALLPSIGKEEDSKKGK